jgi:hypothetical protein
MFGNDTIAIALKFIEHNLRHDNIHVLFGPEV